MEFKKIMVPFDGSEHSVKAIETAKYLAGLVEGSEVHVIKVVGPGNIESGMGDVEAYKSALENLLVAAKAVLEIEVEKAAGSKEGLIIEAVSSHAPIEGIVRYARNIEADVIVMGRKGGGLVHNVLGSVSAGILNEVEIPVVTVK